MREILRLGHKIGVHVDIASVSTVNQAEAKVVSEGTMLSNLLGASVDSFSFHRPGLLKQIKNYNQIDVEGFLNVYEPRLATEIGFISDSRGGWYYGHPIDNKNVLLGRPLQLLTHPIWWASSAKGCVYGHEVLGRLNEHWARQMANTLRAGFKISKENDG
jgi:hypothetical protein